jgi:hypothetical protein
MTCLLFHFVTTLFYNLKCEIINKVILIEQKQAYKVDLTKIGGNGDFPCPRSGNVISPEETSEESYCILEPKVNGYRLEEVVISCNICESHIHLTGFSLLEKLSIE